jgi:hypothetical protein
MERLLCPQRSSEQYSSITIPRFQVELTSGPREEFCSAKEKEAENFPLPSGIWIVQSLDICQCRAIEFGKLLLHPLLKEVIE